MSTTVSAVSILSSEDPFPGLRPFEEQDSTWFFGRSSEINELLKRLRRMRFVAIVGPSGCGKSSLIKAGVLPSIGDGYLDSSWSIATFRPGEQPLENLASAISSAISVDSTETRKRMDTGSMGLVKVIQTRQVSSNSRLLVLVDQFEELFQFAQRHGDQSQEEVKAFLKLLLTAAASDDVPFYLVLTMRMEWLSECASYVGLAEAINEGIYLVPQMSRRQFQQVILNPIDVSGGMITTTVLDRMLNDLGGRSDQLPVLQHALMRLWKKRRDSEPLDVADYESVGTFSNCLSNHAEKVFGDLSDAQQKIAELLFRSITEVYKNRKIRRPRPFGELANESGVNANELKLVIEAFSRRGRSFLFTSEGPIENSSVIDISHEALMRQWDRLGEWVEHEADLHSRLARLQEDATEWERRKRKDRSALYGGYKLQRAEELRPRLEGSTCALDFLKVSHRTERRARLRKRSGILVSFLFLLLVMAILAREYKAALNAETKATKSAQKAQSAEVMAEHLQDELAQAIHAASISTDSKRALASLERTANKVEATKAAYKATTDNPITNGTAQEAPAASTVEKALNQTSLSTQPRLTLEGHNAQVSSVAWSPDGKRLATGSWDNTAKVWDSANGKELLTLKSHTDSVRSVAWSPDGKRLATASDDGTAKVWDSVSGKGLLTLKGDSGWVWSVAWSPDGKSLATCAGNGAKVWDAANGQVLLKLEGHTNSVLKAAWSPDGKRLATASWDGTARVWDAISGKELLAFRNHLDYVLSLTWSPNGTRLATASKDLTVKVWDATTGHELLNLTGYTDEVISVAWSPDGRRLAAGNSDRTTEVWSATNGQHLLTVETGGLNDVAWSPDGKSLATANHDDAARVWDIATAGGVP